MLSKVECNEIENGKGNETSMKGLLKGFKIKNRLTSEKRRKNSGSKSFF